MKYNFDNVVDRKNTNSMKWEDEALKKIFGRADVLPLWVADMDFVVPEFIKEKVMEVAEFGIYGYSESDRHIKEFLNWISESFNWNLERDTIVNTPGVVTAIGLAVQAYSYPGENILIQRPVYYPFSNIIRENGRNIVSNELINKNGYYEIDFEDFENKASDLNTTMFILCSPHNPVGRVWKKEELIKMMDICKKHNVIVISDEIHNDLIMPGYTHYPAGNLGFDYKDILVTCMAPSKSFNLAGMQLSNIIIEDLHLRSRFQKTIAKLGLGLLNPFALVAAEAAYKDGRQWLNQLLDYIYNNFKYLKENLENLEGVKVTDLEGSYLVWVDFRGLKFESHEQLEAFMINEAKVGLDGGAWFGPEGKGFMRFNLAAPRELIEEAVNRVIKAIEVL